MYSTILIIQYIGIAVIIASLYYAFTMKKTDQKELLQIMLIASLINEIGYTMELKCTTMETALTAIKFAYIGKVVIVLAILLFVMKFCEIKVPRWIVHVLMCIHVIVYGLVWNCENNSLFYSSIDYTTEGLYPHVILGHGIVYNLFIGLTLTYVAIMVVVCLIKFIKAKTTSERIKLAVIGFIPIVSAVSLIIFKTGITRGFDTTSLSYVFCVVFVIIAIIKYGIFDSEEIAKEIIIDEFGEPVVVLSEGRIIYSNNLFGKLFSESEIKEGQQISSDIEKYCVSGLKFENNGKYYYVVEKDILQGDEVKGRIYVFNDVTEDQERLELLNHYNEQLEHDVKKHTTHILEMQDKLILGMADMVESRDSNTGGHIKRTSKVVEILIQEIKKDQAINLDDKFCEAMIKAAPMHDLGKIGVDDAILRKPGKYEPWEFEQMKTHPEKGSKIVRELLDVIDDRYFAQIAENVAHYHHERYDGSGYPNHLKGEEIPFEARVMAIADVYDALVSKRCYKDSMSFEKAYAIIEEGMGSQFDEKLNQYFIRCKDKLEKYYMSLEA